MRTLIKNGWLITVDKDRNVIRDGYLVIDEDRITEIGTKEDFIQKKPVANKCIDASGKIVMPGLVNGHTHLFQTFGRGLADDKPLYKWLTEEIWPFVVKMEERDFYLSAMLGCLENIKCGATTIMDQHYVHTSKNNADMTLKAMQESGIRGSYCRTCGDFAMYEPLMEDADTIFSEAERLYHEWHGKDNGRLNLSIEPVNPWGVKPETFQRMYSFATEKGLQCQIHTAETENVVDKCLEAYGKRNVEFFEDLGVLGDRLQLAHCIWVNDKEIELIKQRNALVVYNPVANMYLADGVAPIAEMNKQGIDIALGTDGPGSNNSQDMMEVLKYAVCLQKIDTMDAMVFLPEDIIEMATKKGARVLGRKDIGSLEVGQKADIILVDYEKSHIAPVHNPVSAIVYNANGNDVDTVIIDGKIVMENRKVTFVDESALIKECRERAEYIKSIK